MSEEIKDGVRAGDLVAVLVPDVLPDPTDPAFGCMRDGILRVLRVGEGWFEYEVVAGTVYWRGARGSVPLKYAPYLRRVSPRAGA